ncbi:MAG TPA: DUF4845 domain-containing protein [Steroidobacteraceae bacterium]|jgi:hypothetical protein|nr:DUF4845 domain-containing protein [Steroidobacteraceae bacterium]
MRHSQRGVTFIGWILLLAPIAILIFVAIRLTPIYLNYMSVVKALNTVASENKGETSSAEGLRNALAKHFQVGYVEKPDPRDLDIHRDGTHWAVIADYEETAPLFGNLSLLVEFHKEVDVQ